MRWRTVTRTTLIAVDAIGGLLDTLGRTGRRSLVHEFDALQQKQLLLDFPGTDRVAQQLESARGPAAELFTGILRTADLLASEIIVTDSQLLDGAFFLRLGPDAVRHLMARTRYEELGLIIVARNLNLAECLRQMLLGPATDSPTLASFEFSVLSTFGIDSRKLVSRLRSRGSHRLRSCPPEEVAWVVAAELQAAEEGRVSVRLPSGIFRRIAQYWEAWIAAGESGALKIEAWDTARFNMEASLSSRPASARLREHGERNPQTQAAIKFLTENRSRSTVLSYLERVGPLLTSEAAELLEDWWSSVYFDALARQHKSNWLRLSGPGFSMDSGKSCFAEGAQVIQFEGTLGETLREMPGQVFGAVRYAARDAISRWHAKPCQRSSDALAYAVLRHSEPIDRDRERRTLLGRVWLTLVPAVLGWLITWIFSFTAGLWTGISAALAIVLAVPISELVELHATRSKKMKAYINFPGALRD